MKAIVVGATGTIGSAVVQALEGRYEVISASRNGTVKVDLSDPASIAAMYETVGKIDAVVSTAGTGAFGPLEALSDEDFAFGLGNKLMGQVNLVRLGLDYVNDGGSITLTSGILAQQAHPNTVLITTLNSALEGFVRAAGQDLPRAVRLNAVSPPMIRETVKKMGWGNGGIPAAQIAETYLQSVESGHQGQVIGLAS